MSTTAPLDIPATIAKLSLLEKVQLLTGDGWWHTVALPKHGIPAARMSDGPLGIRGIKNFGGVPGNCFPGGVALASSFDVELAEELGRFVGEEAKSKGAHIWLGPTLNIPRSPLYGRAFENFSEDPLLSGKFTAAIIRGAQSKGVTATPKHFVCYEQNTEQALSSSEVTERAMREIYLKPFQIAIRESNPRAIMTAYNRLNKLHCSENNHILQDILRKEWGFDGLIMSDWYGTYSTLEALKAGLDLEMPGPGVYRGEALTRSVLSGKLQETDLDSSVAKVLQTVNYAIKSGIPFGKNETVVDTPESKATLKKAAAQAVVLLKNDHVNLPITKKVKKLAVIGPNAHASHVCPGGSATLRPLYTVTAYEGIEAYAKENGIEVEYALGSHAFRYAPHLNRLAHSPSGKREAFDFEFYKEDPRQNIGAQASYSIAWDSSEGLMYDEFPRDKVPRFCYMRLHTNFVPDETGEWEFGLSLVGQGKLYVDDKLLVDNYTHQRFGDLFFGDGTVEEKGSIHMEKGKSYHVCLDFDNFNLVDGKTGLQLFGAFRLGASKSLPPKDVLISEAVKLASESDAVIVVVGLTSDYAEEGFDRDHMRLPAGVDDMVSKVLEANSHSTVVVQSGVQCEMPWRGQAASVLQAFYGGNEAGNGLAAVLFGEHNPSSKLPLTFPERLEDFPSHPFFPGKNGSALYNEDVFVGYRHFVTKSTPVIGSFGFGLSYTTFDIGRPSEPTLKVSHDSLQVELDVPVKNTGSVPGGEVVQVYISPPSNTLVPRPALELAAFNKIYLEVGSSKDVRLSLDRSAFSYWDQKMARWRVDAGEYTLHIGNSSDNHPIAIAVTIETGFNWLGL